MNNKNAGSPGIIDKMVKARAVMAPMSGVTDLPFRMICRKYGCRFAFTEMIDVNGIVYNNKKSFRLLERRTEDAPLGLQIVGQDAEKLLYVAKMAEDKGFEVLDVNAGCPARKVIKGGKGSALMKSPEKLAFIIGRLVNNLSIPVTVKMRSGWDEDNINCLELAKASESEGASAICIHPRTREQMYKGRPDHLLTCRIKEAVGIPVFASGNIFGADDVRTIMDRTGCDGVFVARGALGHPWIFNEINRSFDKCRQDEVIPDFTERKSVIKEHFLLNAEYYGETLAIKRMYKHICWYLKSFKGLDAIMKKYRKTVVDPKGFDGFFDKLQLDGKKLIV